MKSKLLSALFLLILCSASAQQPVPDQSNEKLLVSVAWYQHAAEMKALYYQGFNLAALRLDEAVARNTSGKKLAVVVDIDETMLDNSPFQTDIIRYGSGAETWHQWTAKSCAQALPGALNFALYAQSKGVEIFYITNRDNSERVATLTNLKNEKFPYADQSHLLTRADPSATTGNTSSKMARRAEVATTHEIILLIGDNLNDFSEVFENRKSNDGRDAVDQYRENFGARFIILPNPMYGAWEKPLYDYREGLSEPEKSQLLREKLNGSPQPGQSR
jgi:5'-nucleotidase (lipoprotein e(P4) family)